MKNIYNNLFWSGVILLALVSSVLVLIGINLYPHFRINQQKKRDYVTDNVVIEGSENVFVFKQIKEVELPKEIILVKETPKSVRTPSEIVTVHDTVHETVHDTVHETVHDTTQKQDPSIKDTTSLKIP